MAKIPESIDKYKLESLIATGGMGKVYKGIHPTLERPVILKKLTLRGNVAVTERFRREARILMDFRSDNIVDVYDHFKKGSSHYIVMEYVDGISVQGLIVRERYFDNAVSAYIALKTAKALAYAHSKQVVHRDIKPDNVLISQNGDVKLADFGIASDRGGEDENLTYEGMTLGTPSYMAPEQLEDSRTVDGKADLYSLGVMLYEMVTGRKPYPGKFSPDLVRSIQRGRYKKPRRINSGVAPELQRVIAMLMRPNPRKRCADAEEVIRRLQRFLSRYDEASVKARLVALVAATDTEPLRPGRRNSVARWAIGAACFALLAAGGVVYSSQTKVHRRIISPSEYGQVRFIVEGTEVLPESVAITGQRLSEDGNPGFAVNSMRFADRYLGDPQSVVATTMPLNLQAGEYQADAHIDGNQIVVLFAVQGWKATRETQLIRLPLEDAKSRTVTIIIDSIDSATGSDLSQITDAQLLRGSGYVPLRSAGELLSGRVYTLRLRAPGYAERTIVVPVSVGTGVVTISAPMRGD